MRFRARRGRHRPPAPGRVSPSGELAEELDTISLDDLTPEELEQEAVAAGMRAAGRRQVPATPDHIGSTVVLLDAGS